VKQNLNPVTATVLAVLAVVVLGLLGYRVFTATGSSSLPQANPRPTNPDDPKYTPHLPKNVGGGGG
jgi:hypothetical protein